MTIHVTSERQVIQEAAQVLMRHIESRQSDALLGFLAGRRRRLFGYP